MLSYTLENAFMLAVFQLLVSGLILGSSLAILYHQKEARRFLTLVAAAFCLYCLFFLLQGIFDYRSLSLPVAASPPVSLALLLQALEKGALVLLGAAFYIGFWQRRTGKGFWALVVIFLAAAGATYLPSAGAAVWLSSESFSGLANGLFLLTIVGLNLRRLGRRSVLGATALLLLAAAQFLQAAAENTQNVNWTWTISNASLLAGLGLFALVVEGHSSNLPTRFFLRLNLIFIAVASLLILTVAEMERRQYLVVAEQNTQELFEYLRGQVIYGSYQQLDPKEVLSNPELVHKIAADFGRLPDLRRVRVVFQGWAMEMAIGDDWLITQQIYQAGRPESQARRIEDRGRMATLTPVSIESRGTVLGSIEVDESLRHLNAQVARHMRIIYLTFTAAVFLAAGLFGVTVQYAHKTIQRQFQELEKTNAQLINAERLVSVGRLAGGVAHEINNPAGIILTTSDYLLRESAKRSLPASFHEGLEAIRRQAWRVSEIVNGLLSFSRPMKMHKEAVDLNALLRQSLALLAPRFREQRIRVIEKPVPRLPQISADPGRLEQVFVNLLNNAADAMPSGGEVVVETQECQRGGAFYLLVTFADSGSGIAPEQLKSIFDPFFSTKAKGKGTGLGLSVSHGIIRDHSGFIEAESDSGQGAIFRVYLPREDTTP
jgi:signal transduction histidine kinase